MIREYTATGATVEEAIENACRELGVSPLDVTPEILRLPKKGFFKKVLAEVRITVQSDDELLKEDPAPVAPPKKPAPVREKPAAPAPAPKKEEPKPAPVEKKQPAPQLVPAAPQPAAEAAAPAPAAEAPVSLEDLRPKINVAEKYLLEIFEKMGLKDIQVRFEQTENRTVLIHIDGGDIGTVIGKRGETLDAIQYLVSLVANRQEGEYVRFTINAGNYREKREETLRALAQRMAKKVLKTGRPAALEPMNPYERRIIHAVVTEIDCVYSKSTAAPPAVPVGKAGARPAAIGLPATTTPPPLRRRKNLQSL